MAAGLHSFHSIIHTGTRAERHPISLMPTAARRHACDLQRCAIDWHGIQRWERQNDAIDLVLLD